MAYRFSVGCCCDKEIKTCEELIEAGGPFPNITWGDAATVMDDVKSQTGTDNQYGFLWLCWSKPDLYVQRTEYDSSVAVPFTSQQYRTFFEDGISRVRENGNLLAYYISSWILHYADEAVEALVPLGYTVYGTWTKCSDKRQFYWTTYSKATSDKYSASATADRYEVSIYGIFLREAGRNPFPRQEGETDSEWVTRALAENSYVFIHYRVSVHYYVDLTVNCDDFSQYVQDATIYKRWMFIAFSQYRSSYPVRYWYTLSDSGIWTIGLYQWYDITETDVHTSRRYVRHSDTYVVRLSSANNQNYETFKTISEEKGESDLESYYNDLMDGFIAPSVQEFILYND